MHYLPAPYMFTLAQSQALLWGELLLSGGDKKLTWPDVQ